MSAVEIFASQGSSWEGLEDDLSAPTGGWTSVTLSISLRCAGRLGECDHMGDGRWLASGWSQNVERCGWNGIGVFRRISSHKSSYLEIFRPKFSPPGGTSAPRRMVNNSSSTILVKEQKLTPGLALGLKLTSRAVPKILRLARKSQPYILILPLLQIYVKRQVLIF